jgi:hypothetical protein
MRKATSALYHTPSAERGDLKPKPNRLLQIKTDLSELQDAQPHSHVCRCDRCCRRQDLKYESLEFLLDALRHSKGEAR